MTAYRFPESPVSYPDMNRTFPVVTHVVTREEIDRIVELPSHTLSEMEL